jgi:hypothetical protein
MAHAQKYSKGASGGKAASKGKKTPAGGKKVEDDREETLQAVVWTPGLAEFLGTSGGNTDRLIGACRFF